jgi:hypothetical protein
MSRSDSLSPWRLVAGRTPWLIHSSGGSGVEFADGVEGIGFRWGPNGRYVYFRGVDGSNATSLRGNGLPQPAQVMRLDRNTGDIAEITRTPSGAARPAISPNGELMVYVADIDAMAGLRLRNLLTDEDDWLVFPIDREHLNQRTRFTFTPDGGSVVFMKDGTFHEVDVSSGDVREIPFTAQVEQQLGPLIQHEMPFEDDSLIVRNVRYGQASTDGSNLVFGSLNQLWVTTLPDGAPAPLIEGGSGQYQPTFSPDGQSLAFVSWHVTKGGHVWRVPARGGEPQRLTTHPAYYANPVWSADGSMIAYIREDPAADRNRNSNNRGFIEWVPSTGGDPRSVVSAPSDNVLTFTAADSRITFAESGTLVSVRPDGTERREVATVEGAAEMVPSPDGRWLAFTLREEVYVAALPPTLETVTLSERSGPGPFQRVTRDGGQDLKWSSDSKQLSWVFANVFSHLDLEDVFGPGAPDEGLDQQATAVPIRLVASMPKPEGSVALTGAAVVTMMGNQVIDNATVLVTDNRIRAVGPSGSVQVPDDARVIDVAGATIIASHRSSIPSTSKSAASVITVAFDGTGTGSMSVTASLNKSLPLKKSTTGWASEPTTPLRLRDAALEAIETLMVSSSTRHRRMEEILDVLRQIAVEEEELSIRRRALGILASEGDETARRLLLDEIRQRAAAALPVAELITLLGRRLDAESYPVLHGVMIDPPDQAARIEAIRLLGGYAESQPVIVQFYQDPSEPARVRYVAMSSLFANLPDRFPEYSIPVLLDERAGDDLRTFAIDAVRMRRTARPGPEARSPDRFDEVVSHLFESSRSPADRESARTYVDALRLQHP